MSDDDVQTGEHDHPGTLPGPDAPGWRRLLEVVRATPAPRSHRPGSVCGGSPAADAQVRRGRSCAAPPAGDTVVDLIDRGGLGVH